MARRQEILDRAIEVFARRGADKTSLRAIAQEVGVTHAALTHYFGSLEELLVEVYRESERGRLSAGIPPDPDMTPVEIMTESARVNREVAGLVQLYSTLVAAALEEGHPAAREFATARFARPAAEPRRARAGTTRRAAASAPTSTPTPSPHWSSPRRTACRRSGCSTRSWSRMPR